MEGRESWRIERIERIFGHAFWRCGFYVEGNDWWCSVVAENWKTLEGHEDDKLEKPEGRVSKSLLLFLMLETRDGDGDGEVTSYVHDVLLCWSSLTD